MQKVRFVHVTAPRCKPWGLSVCTHVEFDLYGTLNERELRILASRNFNAGELGELIELARRNPDISSLVTHRYPLEEAVAAFTRAQAGEGLKIILLPNG